MLLLLSSAGAAGSWQVRFTDEMDAVGIEFRHAGEVHDPAGADDDWPAFPEIIGSGACWADFDGDGYEDLYIANQRYNHLNPYVMDWIGSVDPTNRLYLNNGDGTFTDVTVAAGVESRTFDHGCSAVDHDGNGSVDLVVYGFGVLKMYRNNGDGTFTDVTLSAGLDVSTLCGSYECWATCASWADYDGDGRLDLFVCTYVESDLHDTERGPAFHKGQYNLLFRNNGDGTFEDVAQAAGVQGVNADVGGSKSLGAVWFDAELDGDLDLYVANDMTPNEFYLNNGDGTFTRDDSAGLADPRASMGVTAGDYDNDGYPDIYVTHYATQHNGFYRNNGDGTFTDLSGQGELASDLPYIGWGTHFVDLDRDGYPDLVAANGNTEWRVPPPYEIGQDTLVYWQEPQPGGGHAWKDVTNASGDGVLEKRVTRGAAFADYDLDGQVDIVLVNNANESLQFLRGSGATNNWLYVEPVQSGANPQAVGARVVLEAGGLVQHREIQAGASYVSQNSLLADFGIGQVDTVERVTVHWPGGGSTTVTDVPGNHVVRIDRETGGFQTDTISPITSLALYGDEGTDAWFRSAVQLTFAVTDRAVGESSGVQGGQMRFNGGPWKPLEDVTVSPADGEYLVEYRSTDNAGNKEPLRRAAFGIDTQAPWATHTIEGEMGANGWWHEPLLVVDAQDTLSGIWRIEYRIGDGDWLPYDGPSLLPDGDFVVSYRAFDRAGNPSKTTQFPIQVDGTAPEVSFHAPKPGTVYLGARPVASLGAGPALIAPPPDDAGFPVTVQAADGTSGVDRVDLFLDDEPVATFHAPGDESVWAWPTASYRPGAYLLSAVAVDVAGNVDLTSVNVVLLAAPGVP